MVKHDKKRIELRRILAHFLEQKDVFIKNNISKNECGIGGQIKQLISFESNRISKENHLCKLRRKLCAMTRQSGSIAQTTKCPKMIEGRFFCSKVIQKKFYLLKVNMVLYWLDTQQWVCNLPNNLKECVIGSIEPWQHLKCVGTFAWQLNCVVAYPYKNEKTWFLLYRKIE